MFWIMGKTDNLQSITTRLQSLWKPTILLTAFFYAFVLHYVVLGIPGISYPTSITKHYFWHEATVEIEKIADDIRQKTGQEPIVVGMSKWSVASSMLFYNKGKNIMDIRSRNMFGDTGSMFEFWSPSQLPSTRPIIMVSMKRNRLEHGPLGNDLNQLLDQLNLNDIRSTNGISLSGGERRRVEIARTLAMEPKFILLDEPFAGVDPISVIDIQRIIKDLSNDGIGILITDHNVRETLKICNRGYIVNDGTTIASGSPEQILSNSEVKKVYLGENFKL